jgi:hypothetical protein
MFATSFSARDHVIGRLSRIQVIDRSGAEASASRHARIATSATDTSRRASPHARG